MILTPEDAKRLAVDFIDWIEKNGYWHDPDGEDVWYNSRERIGYSTADLYDKYMEYLKSKK